jgi:hypothetical protein
VKTSLKVNVYPLSFQSSVANLTPPLSISALFDDDKRGQYFRVLLPLLSAHRNLIEVLLVIVKRVSGQTEFLVETMDTNKKRPHKHERESQKDLLRSIHPRMPAYPTGDVVDLPQIPIETEEMLSSPALVGFLSGEEIPSRELETVQHLP